MTGLVAASIFYRISVNTRGPLARSECVETLLCLQKFAFTVSACVFPVFSLTLSS